MPKKTATFMVEFVTELDADVDPNDVTFDIPVGQVKAQANGKDGGTLKSYTTQEYFE